MSNLPANPTTALPLIILLQTPPGAESPLRSRLPDGAPVLEHGNDDREQALASAIKGWPGRDVLMLSADVALPDYWWPRLALAIQAEPEAELWTPLCAITASLDPRPETLRDPQQADRAIWLLSERSYPPALSASPLCTLWRAALLARRFAASGADGIARISDTRLHLCDTLLVASNISDSAAAPGAADSKTATRHTIATALELQMRAHADSSTAAYPGLDERPVLLHILHGWGGGAERFVADLIAADESDLEANVGNTSQRYRHLVLMAVGDGDTGMQGAALALRRAPSEGSIREWTLSAPIASTVLSSDEYRSILQTICADFAVAGVLLSSLIGHSLDALKTGLPTAVVCHDYYPLWPKLHADFGDADLDFSRDAIAGELAGSKRHADFVESDPSHWQSLRADYVGALTDTDALLIAPTRSVRDNICRIEPELARRRWQQIEHGLAPFSSDLPDIAPDPQRADLRIVVLGRIRGGKGERLLSELLPLLPPDVELVLLGCGAAGMRFFGQSQVHVQLDYQRDELPQLLAKLKPDAALLPSTVSETWSYTLSELHALGVPVIATKIGSFAERIKHGDNGLLVAPDAARLAELLHALGDDCGQLQPLRKRNSGSSIGDIAARYAKALSLTPGQAKPMAALRSLEIQQRLVLQTRLQQLDAQFDAASQQLIEQQDELERRAHWANDQHRVAQERLAWAQNLSTEVERHRDVIGDLQQQAEIIEAELQQRRGEVQQLAADCEQRQIELAQRQLEIESLIEQRDEFEFERNEIIASTSWRLTRPLRYARRLIGGSIARLRFRVARASALSRRGLASLRVRGLKGTLSRAREEFGNRQPDQSLDVPAMEEEFDQLPGIDDIRLELPDLPRVSVIIPVYNHLQHTATCLRSLARHPQRIPFEVIVVDDCSQDASAELLPHVTGLRYQRNEENLGFIGACNAGAQSARGEYLVFLNNDTAVQANWLDALIDTFSERTDAGLVGAKLVYPDGRLQEAGGIVFSDGSGWNYGRFDDPQDPRFGFVREVDYCSGAAIAVPAELFHSLGGFDSHYAPAYYEDTDLAMKVRAAGLAVLYQPASVVVHYEGVSSGTDTASGVKAYQVVNQKKFLERWQSTLDGHASPPPATRIDIARQHRAQRHVLVIDATTPQPDQDSGSVRLVNLLRLLIEEGCAVTFFADNGAYLPGYSESLQQIGVEVLWSPWLGDRVEWLKENGPRFDAVIVSRHYIACSYIDLVRRFAPKATFIFDTVDLHYLREQRAAELAGRDDLRRTAEQTRAQELAVIGKSDVTLVVSPVEQTLLATDAPDDRVEILSNVHEVVGSRRAFEQRENIVFIGGFQHPPNIDAATWFVHEVWPHIHRRAPDMLFNLIGSKASDEVRALGDEPGVVFHGFVEDIEPFLDGCRLAVAPLRYGAGVKGKVNMSMSFGQPVVATPAAVEGMHLRDGEDVLVAQSAEDFADQVLRLYADADLWRTLSENGADNVRQHFGFESARVTIRSLLKLKPAPAPR